MRLICFLFTSMTLLTIATQPHDFLPMITVIYRTISSPADHDLLQRDLDNLESWATTWQMSFNATKCKLLSITNKKKPSKFACSLGSETLSPTDEHDYLGVRCRRDLRWSSNCTKICNKANKRLGLLRRTLKPCDKSVKEQAYLSMVRPLVKYATSAWSPYTNRVVSKLEQVQKNAARFVANNYDPYSNSSSIVSSLNWTSLENRRLLAQAHMFFKIRHNLVNISFPADVKENPRPTRSNPHKYKQLQCNVLAFT